ncbi:MAG: hypothetical protein PHS73_00130, partial [Candidatus Peribacteraceae bacterium]|nr:hypothetical protein [Candidatus Peribacteraceae bacterium]
MSSDDTNHGQQQREPHVISPWAMPQSLCGVLDAFASFHFQPPRIPIIDLTQFVSTVNAAAMAIERSTKAASNFVEHWQEMNDRVRKAIEVFANPTYLQRIAERISFASEMSMKFAERVAALPDLSVVVTDHLLVKDLTLESGDHPSPSKEHILEDTAFEPQELVMVDQLDVRKENMQERGEFATEIQMPISMPVFVQSVPIDLR